MTISYVREILTPKLNDRVLTPYGKGVVTCVANGTTEVCMYFGKLYCRETNFIHKILNAKDYEKAMDKLEEYRRNMLEMECHEKQLPCDHTSCAICLVVNPRKRRPLRKPKVQRCDVCGNLVCLKHKDTLSKDNGQHFVMCFACKKDFDFDHLDIHSSSLHDQVVRWMTSYDRMVIQLSFCINEICADVAERLSSLQSSGSKVKLGATAASFVSGGLAVAGTLTLLTPAGVPLLVAAIATSSASTALQMGNSAFQYTSAKEANQLADRIIGWNGLCLGILGALSRLREILIKEPLFRKERAKSDNSKKGGGKIISLNSASRATSMGLRATSVVAYTPSSAYSSLLRTSVTVTPVFGAALSLGIMACDAQSIHATIRKLQKPSDMALALVRIQKNFPTCIPTSVEGDALLILQVVRELEWLEKQAALLTQSSSVSDRSGHSLSPCTSEHGSVNNKGSQSLLQGCANPESSNFMNSQAEVACQETAPDLAIHRDVTDLTSSSTSIQSTRSSQVSFQPDKAFNDEKKEAGAEQDEMKVRIHFEMEDSEIYTLKPKHAETETKNDRFDTMDVID